MRFNLLSLLVSLLLSIVVYGSACNSGYIIPTKSPPLEPAPIICWGDNDYNQLDLPYTDAAFIDSSLGWKTGCGVDGSNKVWCWGNNEDGQITIPANTRLKSISVGYQYNVCGLDLSDKPKCFGANTKSIVQNTPNVAMSHVSVGNSAACGIRVSDNKPVCWGNDEVNQISNAPDVELIAISAGYYVTCGITTTQSLHCWGDASSWDLIGDMPLTGTYTSVSVGLYVACAITNSSDAVCWGRSDTSQLAVVGGTYHSVEAGWGLTTCGLMASPSTNAIVCWGKAFYNIKGGVPSNVTYNTLVGIGKKAACGLIRDECTQCWPGTYKLNDSVCEPCAAGEYILVEIIIVILI